MKLFTLLALLALGAFASDYVVLDSDNITLESNNVTLEKIQMTPNVVNLIVPIVHSVEMCDPRDERRERYDCSTVETYYDPYCRGGRYGHPPRGPRYPRTGPRRPRGPRYPRTGPRRPRGPRGGIGIGIGVGVNRGCYRTRRVPRMCMRTVCTNPYYEDVVKKQPFTLTFENYNRDAVLDFSLDQFGNLTLLPTTISAGCTKLVKYGSGDNVTGAKLELKRRCR